MIKRLTIPIVLAALHALVGPVSATAQNLPVIPPGTVSSFVLAGTRDLGSGDMHARYMDAEGQRADLYIYAPAENLRAEATSDSVMLDMEASNFVESLKYGRSRGWWETYSMVVEPQHITANTVFGEILGRKSTFVFRRRGSVFVSVMHLFVLNGEFVKSRVSLPAERWDQTDKSQFGLQVMERLTRD